MNDSLNENDFQKEIIFGDKISNKKNKKNNQFEKVVRFDPSLTVGDYIGETVSREEFENENFFSLKKNDLKIDKTIELENQNDDYFQYEEEEDEGEKSNNLLDDYLNELKEDENDDDIPGININKNLQRQRMKEIQKAKNVFSQKVLFNQILKLRILFQKPLNIINENESKINENENENEKDELFNLCQNTLDDIFDLQKDISSIDNNIERKTEKKINVNFQDVDQLFQNNKNKMYKSLNYWDKLTRIQQKNENIKFKTLFSSFEKKVEDDLKRREKIQKEKESNMNLKNNEKKIRYNDLPFYQSLLKDFLKDIGGTTTTSSINESVFSKENLEKSLKQSSYSKNEKKKKKTRTSKSRVLSYEIVPKLVGYMTPIPFKYPENTQNLFNNLFGRGYHE